MRYFYINRNRKASLRKLKARFEHGARLIDAPDGFGRVAVCANRIAGVVVLEHESQVPGDVNRLRKSAGDADIVRQPRVWRVRIGAEGPCKPFCRVLLEAR